MNAARHSELGSTLENLERQRKATADLLAELKLRSHERVSFGVFNRGMLVIDKTSPATRMVEAAMEVHLEWVKTEIVRVESLTE